jgi:hypothetical protein
MAGALVAFLACTDATAAERQTPLQMPAAMRAAQEQEAHQPQPAPAAETDDVEVQHPTAPSSPEERPTEEATTPPDPEAESGVPAESERENTKAPPPRVHRDDVAASGSGTTLKKSSVPNPREFEHRGFTFDFRFGTGGCFKAVCSDSRHHATPGIRLDGFLGSNIRGWVDLGVSGGWGTFGAKVDEGTNVLDLYGIDSALLTALTSQLGSQLGFDFASLAVSDAKLRMARVGPALRIHFIPRGRFAAFVGTGLGYSLFRAKYTTITSQAVRLDFHGIDVPVEAGFAVHVTKNIAVGLNANYTWARYGLAVIDHPDQKLTAPVRVLDEAMSASQGGNLRKDLPQYWTVGAMVRARF